MNTPKLCTVWELSVNLCIKTDKILIKCLITWPPRLQKFGPRLKYHKSKGFLNNTSPDPLQNYKTIKPAFNFGPAGLW